VFGGKDGMDGLDGRHSMDPSCVLGTCRDTAYVVCGALASHTDLICDSMYDRVSYSVLRIEPLWLGDPY